MPNLGMSELIVIGLLIVLLFGGSKIPSLMRGLGQGIREFRREVKGDADSKPAETPPSSKDRS